MELRPDSLRQPAIEIAHRLARDLVRQATQAQERLDAGDDPEALHDFRVALRRLRTVLRVYRPYMRSARGRRVRRRLRQLAAATGECRDLAVQSAWLSATVDGLGSAERVGASWLLRGLRTRKSIADKALERQVGRHFRPTCERLESRLTSYTLTMHLDQPSAEPTYGRITSELLLKLAGAVRRRLAGVESLADLAQAHQARIRAKRLRYVLEPVAALMPEGEPLLASLRQLQDHLGELHDADVLASEITAAVSGAAAEEGRRLTAGVLGGEAPAEALRRGRRRDPLPGLAALAVRLREREEQSLVQLRAAGWIGQPDHEFFARLPVACEALVIQADVPLEIERKYLLNSFPPAARRAPSVDIEQGYLPGTRLMERLRRVRAASGVTCYRTVKLGSGLARTEIEEEASPELFDAMWPLTSGRRILKRRTTVQEDGVRWEIDEFTDRPLVLAEIELPSADSPVIPPPWLEPYIAKEVTGDLSYQNVALAR